VPAVTLTTRRGLDLEAAWDLPDRAPAVVVVLCHPHPLMGGSMDAPLMRGVSRILVAAGIGVLRFNFRGVGRSEGGWSGGTGEIEDVATAVAAAEAAHPSAARGLAGWSFGAHTALRWQTRAGDGRAYAGIAPPVSLPGAGDLPAPAALPPADRLFVIGDRDQFTPAADLQSYAERAGARCEVIAGADHLFAFQERRVGDLLAAHFSASPGGRVEA
jgi:alpha/beta superfamily hydrolase